MCKFVFNGLVIDCVLFGCFIVLCWFVCLTVVFWFMVVLWFKVVLWRWLFCLLAVCCWVA